MAGTRFYGGGRGVCYPAVAEALMERNEPMAEFFDAHRPATAFDHDSTLVVAMELSGKSWQLGAVIPGVSRRPKTGVKAPDMSEVMRCGGSLEGGGGQGWQDDRADSCGLRGGAGRVLDRGRADGAGDRGACDAAGEHPRRAQGAATQNRSHRSGHAVADAVGLAARGASGVHDGARSQRRGGGCAAAGSRARQAGARARRAREPDPESVVPARDWRLPAAPEEGGGEAGEIAGSLRRGAAGADDGPVAAPDEAAQRGERTDRGGRWGAREGARGVQSRPG